ncbi:transmembrane protein 208 [Aplysia californica]|uniref:Transmembrane protein 208 n=1 Tax=Aplysia californica TaxID=6500 RepID=A0ABM0K0E7_APLCA|nr:transmembrane protein 208 [Aplysia californica]
MPPKGKQGTKGKKQIAEENKSTLSFYIKVIAAANVLYYTVYYFLFWDYFTTTSAIMCVLCSVIYLATYQFMASMSRATYHEGQLIDPGVDLNMEAGMAEHIKDLILLTSMVQVATLMSNYFWLLLLLVPGRAFYMLWVNILGPWFFSPPQEEQVDEKKQKKMERKMKRQQIVR